MSNNLRTNFEQDLAVCIPIYKPDGAFFKFLDELLSNSHQIRQLVVFETLDTQFDKSSEFELRLKMQNKELILNYRKIDRKDFHHAITRNEMMEEVICKYSLFSTQDARIGSIKLDDIIQLCESENLDAICVRHEPPALAFRRSWEKMFSQVAHDYAVTKNVGWWSNNFAIYRTDRLKQIPFPEFPFAEDFHWAKMASKMGMHLSYSMRYFIIHLNDDSIKSAYYRGKQEAQSGILSAKFYGEALHKLSLTQWIKNVFLGTLRLDFHIQAWPKLLLELGIYLSFLSHNTGRIRNWNSLLRGNK